MSLDDAAAIAAFEEHRPFDAGTPRLAVEKAGFSYMGMEVIAWGRVQVTGEEEGRPEWALVDTAASMTVRLVAAENDSAFIQLTATATQDSQPGGVQVRGRVLETEAAQAAAAKAGAQFSVSVLSSQPASEAELPPPALKMRRMWR